MNETIKDIMTRCSVREYSDKEISDESIETILKAAMSGPSCANTRDWSFIVVRDREMLDKMAEANGRPAWPLRGAKMAIIVCGDLERAFPRAQEYWVVDGSIAAQNMILAAKALGIGSVWLGTWPQMNRVEALKSLFNLPESAVPHSIISFGYPITEPTVNPDKPEFEFDRVHYEKW